MTIDTTQVEQSEDRTWRWRNSSDEIWNGGYATIGEALTASIRAGSAWGDYLIFGQTISLCEIDISRIIEGALRLIAAMDGDHNTVLPFDMLVDVVHHAGLESIVDDLIEQEHE